MKSALASVLVITVFWSAQVHCLPPIHLNISGPDHGCTCPKYESCATEMSQKLLDVSNKFHTQISTMQTLLMQETLARQMLENKFTGLEKKMTEAIQKLSATVSSQQQNITILNDFMATLNKWTLVFKAVAGGGEDMYQLWSSDRTLNENIPQAKSLTSSLKVHYKSHLVNNWKNEKIKYVKVAFYKGGVERIVLIFDATGSDKMSWFDKGRLISSPYSDIDTASQSTSGYYFSIQGFVRPPYARHFHINKSHNGCSNDIGWIAVINKPGCAYEAFDRYPAFLYAPGHNAVVFSRRRFLFFYIIYSVNEVPWVSFTSLIISFNF
ncbi:uncharacterized protein LOC106175492 [Lingula anatina]|uniref:Uncharacterized protein LOC106175492 n=1 Tax=Lingula anatina TaxID=7574 RepID=A0A1S3JRL0_LINAN|nr:uncharacterized protein LOC106175492 [Lingula anatina]|eukprot:XP_013412977.1 uncharacterized protein LOC106175492 [Lingula anatina]